MENESVTGVNEFNVRVSWVERQISVWTAQGLTVDDMREEAYSRFLHDYPDHYRSINARLAV